jgi:hypothetical protein
MLIVHIFGCREYTAWNVQVSPAFPKIIQLPSSVLGSGMFLLVLTSTVILRSDSRGTHYHILPSRRSLQREYCGSGWELLCRARSGGCVGGEAVIG